MAERAHRMPVTNEIGEAALAAGRRARGAGDWPAMIAAGGELERLGLFAEAWALLADAASIRRPPPLPEWDGATHPGRTLLVERRIRHIGAELRMARFLIGARPRFGQVVAAVEPRLVPLLARSFPEIAIVPTGDAARQGATIGASYERLAHYLGADDAAIAAAFRPLRPPPEIVAQLRARRGPADRPVIGIAWHSTNRRKPQPSLRDWAGLLRAIDAHYVSLQYDEDEAGLGRLRELSGRDIEGAGGIDQRADLDGFAAQVASVDLVVSISNTTAHMAGALGLPGIVLLDDLQHLIWPASAATTPFYPTITLERPGGRRWDELLLGVGRAIPAALSGSRTGKDRA